MREIVTGEKGGEKEVLLRDQIISDSEGRIRMRKSAEGYTPVHESQMGVDHLVGHGPNPSVIAIGRTFTHIVVIMIIINAMKNGMIEESRMKEIRK